MSKAIYAFLTVLALVCILGALQNVDAGCWKDGFFQCGNAPCIVDLTQEVVGQTQYSTCFCDWGDVYNNCTEVYAGTWCQKTYACDPDCTDCTTLLHQSNLEACVH